MDFKTLFTGIDKSTDYRNDCVLFLCGRSLSSCVSPILEVLVLLITDSYSQVAAPANAALERYRDKQDSIDGCWPLVQLLKENLYALVTSLPRRIKMEGKRRSGRNGLCCLTQTFSMLLLYYCLEEPGFKQILFLLLVSCRHPVDDSDDGLGGSAWLSWHLEL